VAGAICFNISSDFPSIDSSKAVKPVTLPPGCARLCAQPTPTGSLALGQERTQCETEIARLPAANKVIALHPGVLARYERQVEQLQASLAAGGLSGDNDGVAALRELIESVAVQRVPGGIVVTITGRLNAILGEEHFPNDVCGKMVAGARFAHSRHPNERGDQPLGFVFILPRVKAR
jgi:hypothetical protein